jgi:hypothetical protein
MACGNDVRHLAAVAAGMHAQMGERAAPFSGGSLGPACGGKVGGLSHVGVHRGSL